MAGSYDIHNDIDCVQHSLWRDRRRWMAGSYDVSNDLDRVHS